jgi:hypothetical protein
MKYLVSQTDVYRVDTVAEVEQLHQELKNSHDFTLSAFSYKTKVKKAQGDIVDEWQLVTAKKEFNDEKDPTNEVSIIYEVE